MPTLDRPRLASLAAHLLANPERHDQREYAVRGECGTSHCAAGWVVVLEGYDLAWTRIEDAETIASFGPGDVAYLAYDPIGRYVSIADEAARLLGLDYDQAEALFHNYGTTDEIVGVIKGFLNEAA